METHTEEAKEAQIQQFLKGSTAEAQLRQIREKVELENPVTGLAGRKRHQPSQQEQAIADKFGLNQQEQERLFQIRKNFQVSLNKLSSNDTKEIVSNLLQ